MNQLQAQHRYMPGLDGLRAVAVILVVLFHADLGWLPGGFVGVSVFFTLSGFLITTVVLRELETVGRIALRRFWAKRSRRLMPAAITCFASVCMWSLLSKSAQTGPGLRLDALAALGNVANWRFALTGKTYADLFAGPSPLLHTWSLSIEEQFYLLFPLLMVGLWKLGLRRHGCALVLAALSAASILAAYLTGSDELAYYGTHTRSGEVLVGAVLALVAGKALTQPSAESRASHRAVQITIGLVSVVAVAAVARWGAADRWALVHGGLGLASLASLGLIVAAIVPGPLRALLSVAPLRMIGRLSYGIYLYHWPIFLWVKSTRFGHQGVQTLVLGLALTLVAATVSFWLIEQPIRTQRWPKVGVRARVGYLAALGGCVLLATTVTTASASTLIPQAGPPSIVTFAPAPTTTLAPTQTTQAPLPPPPVRLLVLGSDTHLADRVATAVAGDHVAVLDRSSRSCPAIATGVYPAPFDAVADRDCPRERWEKALSLLRPDAVLVGISDLERGAYQLPDGTGVAADPASNTLRRAGLAEIVGFLDQLDVPTFITDRQDDEPDFVTRTIRSLVRGSTSVTALASDELERVGDALRPVSAGVIAQHDTLRVLIVGDSTAYALAEGLSNGSDGALSVISAGVIQCPLVHAERVLAGPGVEASTKDCLWFDTDWPRLVQVYDVDLILAVDSLAEQWDQQYSGNNEWHAPGSEAYNLFHDQQLINISATLEDLGLPLLIADAPALRGDIGAYFGNDPARIAAWNATIARWDHSAPAIKVVTYAQWFSDPSSEQGRAERPDGVHVTREFSEQMTREHLLSALQSSYIQALADIKQAD